MRNVAMLTVSSVVIHNFQLPWSQRRKYRGVGMRKELLLVCSTTDGIVSGTQTMNLIFEVRFCSGNYLKGAGYDGLYYLRESVQIHIHLVMCLCTFPQRCMASLKRLKSASSNTSSNCRIGHRLSHSVQCCVWDVPRKTYCIVSCHMWRPRGKSHD